MAKDDESLIGKAGIKHTLEEWEKGGKTGSNPWLHSEDLNWPGWKDWIGDVFVGIESYEYGGLPEDATYKDYMFELQKSQQPNQYNNKKQWEKNKDTNREKILGDINKKFPDRKLKDKEGKEQLERTPFMEGGRPFKESDVTEAILEGALKKPEPKYTGPFGKLGEHFAKNAAARDKLFSMMGSMGRELVKPIQPGQAAAGALLPTLSRGLGKGETEYAAKQAAGAKTALDIASARQKISPLQYYSSKMQEARLAVPSSIEGGPDSAAGKRWIGQYLMSVGMPSQVVDLTSSLDSLKLQLLSAPSDAEKKRIQGLVDKISRQIQDLVSQSIGGSSVSDFIPYSP
jgi:hypothetical protein